MYAEPSVWLGGASQGGWAGAVRDDVGVALWPTRDGDGPSALLGLYVQLDRERSLGGGREGGCCGLAVGAALEIDARAGEAWRAGGRAAVSLGQWHDVTLGARLRRDWYEVGVDVVRVDPYYLSPSSSPTRAYAIVVGGGVTGRPGRVASLVVVAALAIGIGIAISSSD